MKYFARVNGREHEVEVVERLGELVVSVGGQPLELDYCEVDQLGQVSLLAGEESYAVSIEPQADGYAITIAGHLYSVAIEDERERAARAAERQAAGKGGVLKSVMPGIVVKVLVQPGEAVAKGQPLVILEAMKMQNEIAAEADGVVTELHVAEGQAVAGGEKLVTLGEA